LQEVLIQSGKNITNVARGVAQWNSKKENAVRKSRLSPIFKNVR
jgi:hypothetical protein